MEIFAIPRYRMEQLMGSESFSAKDYNIISIIDSDAEWIFAEPTEPNVLQLRFDDLEAEDWTTEAELAMIEKKGWIIFSEVQAKQILEFMNKMDTSKDLIVHCTAGKCRSGAVADFARVKFGIPFWEFVRLNPQVQPNSWVRKTLFRLEFGENEVRVT